MNLRITRNRFWIGLCTLILLLGMNGQFVPAHAGEPSRDQLENAMKSTMEVFILNGQLKIIGGCTGTVIDPAGYVLTNFHCVGYITRQKNEGTPGTFHNPQGVVAVGPTLDPRKPPTPTYFAKFVAGNYDLDVAVVKIVAMVNQGQKLPDPLRLVSMTRSDSDSVQIGDYVGVIGYPAVGGETVTFTDGKISGYDDENDDGVMDSFKTTAAINPGNSGGLAISERGEQIGIPTWGIYNSQSGSKLDRVVMINVAEPYIQRGLAVGNVTGNDIRPTNPPANPPKTNPPSGKSGFSNIRWGTDVADDKLVGTATSFPAGITKLVAMYDYAGMKDGMDWGYVWQIDGQNVAGDTSGQTWESGASGSYYNWLNNKGKALPSGTYSLTLYVNGAPVGQATTKIGQPSENKPQAPPAEQSSGVVVTGQVIDTSTKRGIPGGIVIILTPGVTQNDIDRATTAEQKAALVLTSAETDKNGNYQTVALPRGKTYGVLVGADGYQTRAFLNGLDVAADDPDIVKIQPVELKKK